MTNYFDLLSEWFEFDKEFNHQTQRYWEKKYEEIKFKKELFRPKWNNILSALLSLNTFSRIKDMDAVTEHYCFKAILTFKNQPLEGIVLHISMVGGLFGFGFASHLIHPFISVISYEGRVHHDLSYYPFSLQQEKTAQEVGDLIKGLIGFTHFDALNASLPCYGISIAGEKYERMDLFQAFFGTHLYGIL
jgi:hypothetical protein